MSFPVSSLLRCYAFEQDWVAVDRLLELATKRRLREFQDGLPFIRTKRDPSAENIAAWRGALEAHVDKSGCVDVSRLVSLKLVNTLTGLGSVGAVAVQSGVLYVSTDAGLKVLEPAGGDTFRTVGSVAIRRSMVFPDTVRPTRPSWGTRRSAMLMSAMTLSLLTRPAWMALGERMTSWSTPSTR